MWWNSRPARTRIRSTSNVSSLNVPPHVLSIFNISTSRFVVGCFPRYETDKQAVRHQEEREETAEVRLHGRGQVQRRYVSVTPDADTPRKFHWLLPSCCFLVSPSSNRMNLPRANFGDIPCHWDKMQVPETGYKVVTLSVLITLKSETVAIILWCHV